MKLADALEIMLPQLRDELIVHANGMISRESFTLQDRPGNFYMIGSMGLASSIGLGLAAARPDRRVVVFDGDGNVLMNLGSLAMAGALRPKNYFHVCFDNGTYGSTGNQRTISTQVALDDIAAAAGYEAAVRVDTPGDLDATFAEWLGVEGPRFLLVRIEPDLEEKSIPRVSHEPEAITKRFRQAVASG